MQLELEVVKKGHHATEEGHPNSKTSDKSAARSPPSIDAFKVLETYTARHLHNSDLLHSNNLLFIQKRNALGRVLDFSHILQSSSCQWGPGFILSPRSPRNPCRPLSPISLLFILRVLSSLFPNSSVLASAARGQSQSQGQVLKPQAA